MKNKILVIEDDRAISELLCMNLEAAGYETVAAYDGEEAQRLLLWHEDADMAVVDIMLPGKDGFALMEDFKKKDLPVLYLTAKDDVASKVNGLKLGAEDYILKPLVETRLLPVIKKIRTVNEAFTKVIYERKSTPFCELNRYIHMVAPTDSPERRGAADGSAGRGEH